MGGIKEMCPGDAFELFGLEQGLLQEPVRGSVRGTSETDVFRQHTIGPL